jgi:hypothetical protein
VGHTTRSMVDRFGFEEIKSRKEREREGERERERERESEKLTSMDRWRLGCPAQEKMEKQSVAGERERSFDS